MQTENGTPMMSLQGSITATMPVSVDPVACTLSELRQKLLVLNR